MRTLVFSLAALLMAAGMAAAQVAAPSFNPTPTISLTTPNPAIAPWDGPSRIGASVGKLKFDDPITTPTVNPDATGNTTGLLAQYVGDMFAVGVAQSTIKIDFDASLGGGFAKSTGQVVQAGVQFAKRFSLGVSQELVKQTDSAGGNQENKTIWAGGTVRLADVVYLGAAYGSETQKDKAANPQLQLDRKARKIGVAYESRDKDRGLHLEFYKTFAPAAADPTISFTADESDVTGGAVEFVVSRFFFGYSQTKEKAKDIAGVAKDSTTSKTLSLGFVPEQGLAIVLNHFANENNDPVTGVTTGKASATDIGVAWMF